MRLGLGTRMPEARLARGRTYLFFGQSSLRSLLLSQSQTIIGPTRSIPALSVGGSTSIGRLSDPTDPSEIIRAPPRMMRHLARLLLLSIGGEFWRCRLASAICAAAEERSSAVECR